MRLSQRYIVQSFFIADVRPTEENVVAKLLPSNHYSLCLLCLVIAVWAQRVWLV